MVFKTLTSFPKGQKCQLCLTAKVDPEALGNICQTADVIVHYFCLLLASKIQQKGTDKQGLLGFFSRDIKKEIKRGSTIVCHYCKKNGATVMCSKESCHLNFHVPCAQQKGSLHQYFNQFKSFCEKHKPRQKIPASLKNKKDLECVLCCSHIKFNVKSHEDDPIWPTCCKPQALLHKRCLQHFATSSGYYFKCPFCSNKEEFHKGMKTFGIYIPEQEASWETEPNAYRELLERDVSCDAVRCRCPRGPVYSVRNSKWYMEVCILCGASGRHRGCMVENIMTDTYECDVCSKVNKKYPNSIPTEDIPESSPLSDKGECNETVQQSVEESISKNLSLECEEIVVISDSESENDDVEIIDVIPPPTATKNVRKRQLPILQEKRSGLKRQRLAESGAETSSEMCFTIDEESRSPLAQAMDNPSFRTDKLPNNPLACEINFPNSEPLNEKILMINKVLTLSEFDQKEIDRLHADISNSNEVDNNQSHIRCVDLVSDNESIVETDQVLVISDTDSQSNASSLLDSDGSLLDLSEIPESEKSLLLENLSPPKNYAKEFSRRTPIPKKRRKKKKRVTQKKKITSIQTPQNHKCKSSIKSNETLGDKQIIISSERSNLEPTCSQDANTSIPSSSHLENCNSSEDESFRGFCCEEIQPNNESVVTSTPILVKGSVQANRTCSNDEKIISSPQHMSGNHIFLSSVDDTSKCFTLDNHNLIDKVKDLKCQVADLDENTQTKCADDNTIKTISNSIVLKLFEKDDKNCNKSVSNNCELSKCKINNYTNVSVTSIQEVCSNKSSIDAVICNSDPLELSRNSKNITNGKFDSDEHEVTAVSHQAINLEKATNVNSPLIEENVSEKKLKKTSKTKTKAVINKSKKSGYALKTKQPKKNINKPKIICSLALEQPFGKISHSLFKSYEVQDHKNKSCNEISETSLLPVNQFFNVSCNSIDDSQSPKSCREVYLEPHSSGNCTETNRELERSSIHSTDLPMGSLSSERVSDLAVLESKSTSEHQAMLEKNVKEITLDSNSIKKLPSESPLDTSKTQVEVSSGITIEIPLNSKFSENISKISPVASSCSTNVEIDLQSSKGGCESSLKLDSSETTNKPDLESQVITEHSEPYLNSLFKKRSFIKTSTDQIESKTLSQSEIESIPSESISESPMKSDTSAVLLQPSIAPESSKLNSEISNFSENGANLKVLNVKEEKNIEVFQSLVNSPFQEFKSCKLVSTETTNIADLDSELFTKHSEPYQSSPLEKHSVISASQTQIELKNSESNLEIPIESKISSESEVDSVSSKLNSEVDLQLSKVSLLQVHNVLPSIEPNLSKEQLVSETHDFSYDSSVHFKSDDCMKSEDSTGLNSSIEVSKVYSYTETKYTCDESQMIPPLDEELGECFKNLVQANKRGKLKTTSKVTDENKLPIENESNLKDVEDSNTLNDVYCIRNQDPKITTQKMLENQIFVSSNFDQQISIEDSEVQTNTETKSLCDKSQSYPPSDEELGECFKNQNLSSKQENLKTTLAGTGENKLPTESDCNLNDIDESMSLNGKMCFIKNQDCRDITNIKDENNVNCASSDQVEIKQHDRYKVCITECSTCYNSVTLTAKHNIVMNDAIEVCFYCKGKINNISVDTPISQDSSTCSCQEHKDNFSVNYSCVEKHHEDLCSEVFKESKLSKDYPLVESDLNSNCKSNESFENQKSSSNDKLKIGCKEINTQEKLYGVLSPERRNMVTESEEQHPMQVTPDFIENSLSEVAESEAPPISKKRDPEISKIELVANINNVPTDTVNKKTIQQISDNNDNGREPILKCYYNEVFKVRIVLKEVDGGNNSPSLISHVESFLVHNRKRFGQLLKKRYFTEDDEKLIIYTDVCGFRYTRLFVENIPEKINPRVVFESGGDISYYLQKLIRCYKTEQVISPQIILIVYGNSLIPDTNVFHLLQLASNLKNIKLVVTTVPSQKHKILKFNQKLIHYSKKFGYDIWDITKIHFLTDSNER